MTKIYHNNKCSKSRIALKELTDAGEAFEVINYLENPPSVEELTLLVEQLGIKPFDLIRTNEAVFKEKFKGKQLADVEWLAVLQENPILIQRPIVVRNGRAVIARSDDAIDEILA